MKMVPVSTSRPCRFGSFISRIAAGLLGLMVATSILAPNADAFQDFGFGGFGQGAQPTERVVVEGKFYQIGDSDEGYVEIIGTIGDGLHAYSMKQQPGGTNPSELHFSEIKGFKLLGGFEELTKPHVVPPANGMTEILEFEHEVKWAAKVKFDSKDNLKDLTAEIIYDGQVCEISGDKSCYRVSDVAGEVSFGGKKDAFPKKLQEQKVGTPKAIDGETSFQAGHAKITARLVSGSLYSGGEGVIEITADVEDPYHTYPFAQPKDDGQPATMPTYIGIVGVENSAVGKSQFKFKNPVADPPAMPHMTHGEMVEYHEGQVTWTIKFKVPQQLLYGQYVVHGLMVSQTCNDQGCDAPAQIHFKIPFEVAGLGGDKESPAVFEEAKVQVRSVLKDSKKLREFWATVQGGKGGSGAAVAGGGSSQSKHSVVESDIPEGTEDYNVKQIKPQVRGQVTGGLAVILPIALLGGFILNFMPCVLPVIGLKVLSLVEQAGESRAKAIAVNLVYVLGILSVFWVLAFLLIVFKMGWGSQFSNQPFTIFLCGLIFAMALSFLDVWEITLPGFIGSGSAKLDNKDGWVGTFFKGAVTTVLATPCSGPGLSTALAWCSNQDPWVVILVFTALGLGMGLPYIVIGIFPKSVSFLPKPGPWMNTFKEVMGFVLLATVCFFLSYIRYDLVFPTICLLMAIWFVCWMIGRLDFSSTPVTWIGTWVTGVAIVAVGTLVIYGWDFGSGKEPSPVAAGYNLYDLQKRRVDSFVDNVNEQRSKMPKKESEFEKFTLQALQHHTQGENPKAVFIDFTADWCITCKSLEQYVLKSSTIHPRLMNKEQIIPMVADKTFKNEEIDAILKALGAGDQIPIYAIFPAGKPFEPIVLSGSKITRNTMTEILDELGIEAIEEGDHGKEKTTKTSAKSESSH